jgi:hypothetical protein
VRDRLAENHRREAAREVLATFGPEDLPSPERERELLDLWSTPAEGTAPTTPTARARRKSSARDRRAVKAGGPVNRR